VIRAVDIEEASSICMDRCRAACCQGPLVLRLGKAELDDFRSRAASRGLGPVPAQTLDDGGGLVRFTDYPGDRCPMLDPGTWACRIYSHRPSRCRDFPERLTPGCALSEAVFGGRDAGAG
jgi:Fe-S-cluster containining protein